MVELDLSFGGVLTPDQSRKLTELEPVVRDEYTKFIGELIRLNEVSGETWLLSVTCRNPDGSQLFERLVRLALLHDYLSDGETLSSIRVDSVDLGNIVSSICKRCGSSARLVIDEKSSDIPAYKRVMQSIYGMMNGYLWPRLIRGKLLPETTIILLEGILSINSFSEKQNYKDSYYPGLLNVLESTKDRQKIWYLILYSTGLRLPRDYIKLWWKVRKSKEKLVIKEDWLKSNDYFWAFIKSISLKRKLTTIPSWRNQDISPLVQRELNESVGSRSLIETLLCYRFFHRIKKSGVNIEGVIDWSENQVIDRALCLGVKRNYPQCLIKGYQGYFVPEYYVHHDVTEYERDGGTTPDQIVVVSPLLEKQKSKYCPDLWIDVGPAFRFSGVAKNTISKNFVKKDILFGLPIQVPIAKEMLALCASLPCKLQKEAVIRPHPHMKVSTLNSLIVEARIDLDRVKLDTGDIYEQLPMTKLLVSSSSSVCVEALCMGVPVAILGSLIGLTQNPLQGRFPTDWWRVCYSDSDLQEFLLSFKEGFSAIPSNVFCEINSENVRQFVDFKIGRVEKT